MTELTPTITCRHLRQATVPLTTRHLPTQVHSTNSHQALPRPGRPTSQPITQVPTQGTIRHPQCPMEYHRPLLTVTQRLSSPNSSLGQITPSNSKIIPRINTEGAVADITGEATITTIAEVPTNIKEVATGHSSIRTPTVVGDKESPQGTIRSMISGIASRSSPRISGRPSSLGIATPSRERSQRRRSRRGAGSSCGRRSSVTHSEGVAHSLRLICSIRRAGMMHWWRQQAHTPSN